MANSEQQKPDFESVKARLSEIAETIDDESLSLDDALDLYEEAVALGLQASDLLETGVVLPEDAEGAEGSEGAEGAESAEVEGGANGADASNGGGNAAGAGNAADAESLAQ